MTSPTPDVFSNTSTITSRRPLPSRKPLPPIVRDVEDAERPYADKPAALPPIPSPSTPKKRSLSVSGPSSPPLPKLPSNAQQKDDDGDVQSVETTTLHGFLDVFKGELSSLDPISVGPLDLRDPSTPSRHADRQSQDERKPSEAEETDNDCDEEDEEDDLFAPSAIIPPRSSSLVLQQSHAKPSLGSVGHATSSRQHQHPHANPLRSRSGPPVTLAPLNQSQRDTSRLRVLHRSTASNSEPSLISAVDYARANGEFCISTGSCGHSQQTCTIGF